MHDSEPKFDLKGDRRAVGVLWLLAVACVAALLHGGGRLYFGPTLSDLTAYFYPRMVFLSRWLKRGVFPFWDPHVFGGYPVVESLQLATFYPPTIVPVALLAPGLALDIAMALNTVAAFGFGYLAFRKGLRLSRPGSVLAVSTFVLGGAFATRVGAGHFTVAAASAWFPAGVATAARMAGWTGGGGKAISRSRDASASPPPSSFPPLPSSPSPPVSPRSSHLFAFRESFFRRGLWRWFLLTVGINAMTILSGAPQYVIYLLWMEIVAVVAWGGRRRWATGIVWLGAAWVVAALLSAPQWLPGLVYFQYTGRSKVESARFSEILDRVTLVLELVLPLPLGSDLAIPHLHRKNVWETASYPGTTALVLAGAGVLWFLFGRRWRGRRGLRMRLGVAVIGLGLYLCMVNGVPGMAHFREPLKARIVLALGLSLCAGAAFDRLGADARRIASRRGGRGGARKKIRGGLPIQTSLFVVFLAAWGLVGSFLYFRSPVELLFTGSNTPMFPEAQDEWKAMGRSHVFLEGKLIPPAVNVSLVLGALLLLWLFARRRRRAALAGVFLLGCLEPAVWFLPYFYSCHPYSAGGIPGYVSKYLHRRVERTRRAGHPPWRVTFPNEWTNEAHMMDGLLETGGYDPLMPALANNRNVLMGSLTINDKGQVRQHAGDALGRRFDFMYWDKAAPGRRLDVESFRVSRTADIAGIVRNVRAEGLPFGIAGPSMSGVNYVVPGKYLFRAVTSDQLTPEFRREVETIRGGDGSTSDTESGGDTAASSDSLRMLAQKTPGRYEFEVRLRAPALFLLKTTWLPGWHGRVDDGPAVTPWLANSWMLGLPVGRGSHRVVFYYLPVYITLSAWVALAGWVAFGMGWLFAQKRRRGRRGN